MQIEEDQSACPVCGAAGLVFSPVVHHMLCAYVGPQYDFAATAAGLVCPKCRRELIASEAEIVGTSARCVDCRAEFVVSPSPASPRAERVD
jgi:DNA-directed RNA polymerase subunit RPC12/RpoP